MRARPTSIVSFQPSAAGITWNTSSAPTPAVVHSHRIAFATVANMASGTGRPGLPCFHAVMAQIIRAAQIHEPTTTSRSPM